MLYSQLSEPGQGHGTNSYALDHCDFFKPGYDISHVHLGDRKGRLLSRRARATKASHLLSHICRYLDPAVTIQGHMAEARLFLPQEKRHSMAV